MTPDGQGGGFDGPSRQIDLKAHFQGLKDLQAERRIAMETARVALELSQHADVFGFQEDSSREDIAVKLIKSLNHSIMKQKNFFRFLSVSLVTILFPMNVWADRGSLHSSKYVRS